MDFVLEKSERLAAIEVKSSRRRDGIPGMGIFPKKHLGARAYLIGGNGMRLEEFFSAAASDLV